MFKLFDEFSVNENINEKFKVKPHDIQTPNGVSAFLIKYVGPNFDKSTLEAYLKSNPQTNQILQSLQKEPNRYFIAYDTKKDGESRIFGSNLVWKSVIELIDSEKNGTAEYAGFNLPPYNNLVPFNQLDNIAISTKGDIVKPVKDAIGNPILPANAPIETTNVNKPLVDTNSSAQVPVSAKANLQPSVPVNPAVDQSENKANPSSDINEIINSFSKLKPGSRGPLVAQLQRSLELVAQAKKDSITLSNMKFSIRKDNKYDGIWGNYTSAAIKSLLNVDGELDLHKSPEILTILAQDLTSNNITAKQLTDPTNIELSSMTNTKNKNVTNVKGITATNSVGSKPDQTIKPIQKQQSAQPVATPNQEIGDYVESTNPNYGKIYFA